MAWLLTVIISLAVSMLGRELYEYCRPLAVWTTRLACSRLPERLRGQTEEAWLRELEEYGALRLTRLAVSVGYLTAGARISWRHREERRRDVAAERARSSELAANYERLADRLARQFGRGVITHHELQVELLVLAHQRPLTVYRRTWSVDLVLRPRQELDNLRWLRRFVRDLSPTARAAIEGGLWEGCYDCDLIDTVDAVRRHGDETGHHVHRPFTRIVSEAT